MHTKTDDLYVRVGPSAPGELEVAARAFHPSLQWLRELVGYTVGALAGLAADAGLLMLLVDGFGFPVLGSAAVAFTAGALVVYAIAVRIAFRRHRLQDRRLEFLVFVAVGGGGLLVTLAVMAIGTQWLLLDYRLCKVFAAGGSFLFNYAARKTLLF